MRNPAILALAGVLFAATLVGALPGASAARGRLYVSNVPFKKNYRSSRAMHRHAVSRHNPRFDYKGGPISFWVLALVLRPMPSGPVNLVLYEGRTYREHREIRLKRGARRLMVKLTLSGASLKPGKRYELRLTRLRVRKGKEYEVVLARTRVWLGKSRPSSRRRAVGRRRR